MKSVGIDIGSTSIKVVEITQTNKGIVLNRFIEHPLGTNPAFDPEIEIIEFLKSLREEYDPASVRFVAGLRQDRVSVRHKVFPFNDRIKIHKSLAFELEEDLPFSSETAIFDAKIIRTIKSTAEVLACATPKHRVAEIIERFESGGIDLSIVSAEGIAIANTFEKFNEPPPEGIGSPVNDVGDEIKPHKNLRIHIHLGHTRTLISVFEDNLLVSARSVLFGGKSIAEHLAKRYELPYVEALKELRSKGFILASKEGASYDQIVFSDTIMGQIKELGKEIKITMMEIEAEINGSITSATISGGISNIQNIHAALTQHLEIPVNKVSMLKNFANIQFEVNEHIDSIIGVALGIAIEGVKKPRNPPLQFMRGDFARQNHYLKQLWADWGKSLQFAAAAYLIFMLYSSFRDTASYDLSERAKDVLKTQALNVGIDKKKANEKGVTTYIREQKKKINAVRSVESFARMNSAIDILKKISEVSPKKNDIKLQVRKLSIQDSTVSMEGVLGSVSESDSLKAAIAQVASDSKFSFRAGNPGPNGNISFSANFRVDRNVRKE